MPIEIYETEIGLFKVMEYPGRSNLLFVQRYLPIGEEDIWTDMGHMKKKEFLKLIKPHSPKKREDPSNVMDSTDPLWKTYASIDEIVTPTPEILTFTEPTVTIPRKGVKMVPVLKPELAGKLKVPIDIFEILNLCNGNHTIEDICEKTNYPRLKVSEVIRKYQKKGWVEIMRIT